jgi:hypothetical protein
MAEVRIGELSAKTGLSVKALRRLADAEQIPSHRTSGGHRLFDPELVRAVLARGSGTAGILPSSPPDWSRTVLLDDLHEDQVWSELASALEIDIKSEEGRLAAYAFTEMLNNAIDHSGGKSARIEVWLSPSRFTFRICDDGEGVFAHLRKGLGLERDIDSAAELTKGKRTTMKDRHSGEGIFFTSKAVGIFRLAANGLRLTVDNARGDTALGVDASATGTAVEVEIPRPPTRTLREVFAEYTDEEGAFFKSRPTVKLFGAGTTFVSRSEARRLFDQMEAFGEIDVDFAGVEDVGQGFIDEALRVWPSQHPEVKLNPINMNEAVEFMVKRALRSTSL